MGERIRVLLTEEEVDQKIREMADQINEVYGDEPIDATQQQRLHFLSIVMAWTAEATEECADIASGDSE